MASGLPLAERLADRIRHVGPISASTWIDAALYDPDEGFYTAVEGAGGRAGRRGDFLTAPEVGPLFGAVVARALDQWWTEAGRPSWWPVIEVGAGPGTLVRSVLAAEPDCVTSKALRWYAVERSAVQRADHPEHELVISSATMPEPSDEQILAGDEESAFAGGLVLANELLDNLPFDIVERTAAGWSEVRVGLGQAGHADQAGHSAPTFREVLVDLAAPAAVAQRVPAEDPGTVAGLVDAESVPLGTRIPVQRQARRWVQAMHDLVPGGRIVVFDYGADTATLAARRDSGWLRVYRGHRSGAADRSDAADAVPGWLDAPGCSDITTDVAIDQIQLDHRAHSVCTQAEMLRSHGIDELVRQGAERWRERAHIGDLEALAARSRVTEAEALLDPEGMGGFFVIEWRPDPLQR